MYSALLPLIGLLVAAVPAPTAAPLAGDWAGDGFALRSAPTGTIVQGKCASGKISQPILVGRDGGFSVTGYYNPYTSGYGLSDLAPRDRIVQFDGKVTGQTLVLTMRSGERPDARYTLRRGAPIKFARCH